jgi:hypothetical protein
MTKDKLIRNRLADNISESLNNSREIFIWKKHGNEAGIIWLEWRKEICFQWVSEHDKHKIVSHNKLKSTIKKKLESKLLKIQKWSEEIDSKIVKKDQKILELKKALQKAKEKLSNHLEYRFKVIESELEQKTSFKSDEFINKKRAIKELEKLVNIEDSILSSKAKFLNSRFDWLKKDTIDQDNIISTDLNNIQPIFRWNKALTLNFKVLNNLFQSCEIDLSGGGKLIIHFSLIQINEHSKAVEFSMESSSANDPLQAALYFKKDYKINLETTRLASMSEKKKYWVLMIREEEWKNKLAIEVYWLSNFGFSVYGKLMKEGLTDYEAIRAMAAKN